ncbi:MAG: L-threonine 3-dehydrogenase [Gemmatimonadota bacterium]|nr:MAG: L-threonine 3-dehydrogenase [Gemmatimonadota bacterium]
MKRILVTGALGQIGTELVSALRERYGTENVIASDIRMPQAGDGPFEFVDVTQQRQIDVAVRRHGVDAIYHLAAILSAVAEEKPHVAWDVNMGGLYRTLEVARASGCAVFVPSSIGAFGPSTPRESTPQDTVQRPTTMYGVTKAAGELLCDYYHARFGVDTRGVRFPGLVSHVALPGGGTTDYAVEIFYEAIKHGRYTCYLGPDTRLDMMYMPDALKAAIDVMEADPGRLVHRNAFNVTAMNFTPAEVAEAIRRHLPDFRIEYRIDPVRQRIADSWPHSISDAAAREEWDWSPDYDLARTTEEMLASLRRKLSGEEEA